MPDASYVQTNFLGGEWSAYYQGRMDNPRYRMAMNRCLNAIPVEEGACTRRPGTRFAAPTRDGDAARILPFNVTQSTPFNLEFTAGHLRIFAGPDLVKEDVVDVISLTDASPSVVTVYGPVDWVTGDVVQFLFPTASTSVSAVTLRNRQVRVTMTSTTTFTMEDPLTGDPVDGVEWDPLEPAQVARIVDFATPFTSLADLRTVQDEETALILSGTIQPYVLSVVEGEGQFTEFSFYPARFLDGPYLDPPIGAVATPSATTGIINVVVSYQTWDSATTYAMDEYVQFSGEFYISLVNSNLNQQPSTSPAYWEQTTAGAAAGGTGFASGDVGRLIRLFSEPLEWDPTETYSPNDKVTYNDSYYTALTPDPDNDPDPNLDKVPDLELAYWAFDPSAAGWSWGEILAINSSTSVSVQLMSDLLYDNPINTWRLGVYSDKTGYPTCGCYHEGRFWLAGAQGNRVDASKSNDPFNFSPTAVDGAVADDNGISAIFNADKINTLLWLMPDYLGVICGTQEGEWLIQASSINDPLTPTSIQAHKVTTYGSEPIEPVRTGLSTIFVQRYGRKVMELMSDKYSSGSSFSGNNLSLESKHLTASNVLEVCYQEELTPIVWARNGDEVLIGCTYRRLAGDQLVLSAWHRHELGSDRTVVGISAGPSVGGDLDSLALVTKDEDGIHHVEFLTNLFDQDDTIYQAWFLDNAVTPSGASSTDDDVTFYGLWHFNGKTVTIFAGGLDLGEFLIADGQVTVPFSGDFTAAYLQELSTSGEDFGGLAVTIDTTTVTPPPVVTAETILAYNTSAMGGDGHPYWDDNLFFVVTGSLYSFDLTTGELLGTVDTSVFTGAGGALLREGVTAYDGLYYCGNNAGKLCRFDFPNLVMVDTFSIDHAGYIPEDVRGMAPIYAGGVWIVVSSNYTEQLMTVVYADDLGMSSAYPKIGFGSDILSFAWPPPDPDATAGVAYGIGTMYNSTAASVDFHVVRIDRRAVGELDRYQSWDSARNYVVGEKISYHGGNQAHGSTYNCLSNHSNQAPGPVDTAYWERVENPFISFTTPFSFTASDIDSEWTIFANSAQKMVFDEYDGNLITIFKTSETVTTNAYIVKFSPADGTIIWQVAMPTGFSLGRARIRSGIYCCASGGLGDPRTVFRMDTTDGSITTQPVYQVLSNEGGVINTNQIYDDTQDVLVSLTDYSAGGLAPTPLYDTPAGFTQLWAKLYPGSFITPPTISDEETTFPVVIGFPYTTQCQILRPFTPQDSGARNGPAFAKTRREERFGALLHKCVINTISFGTTFNKLRPGLFKTAGGTAYTPLELYSGVFTDTLEDDYTYNSMLCWQITGPYPGTVLTIGGFITTNDR